MKTLSDGGLPAYELNPRHKYDVRITDEGIKALADGLEKGR